MPNADRPGRQRAHLTASRVTGLMQERHVSVAALAESVRIQRSTLENYCAGRVIPTDLLAAIARSLQTTMAYLTGVSEDSRPALGAPPVE